MTLNLSSGYYWLRHVHEKNYCLKLNYPLEKYSDWFPPWHYLMVYFQIYQHCDEFVHEKIYYDTNV